jgi:hypothetical protein
MPYEKGFLNQTGTTCQNNLPVNYNKYNTTCTNGCGSPTACAPCPYEGTGNKCEISINNYGNVTTWTYTSGGLKGCTATLTAHVKDCTPGMGCVGTWPSQDCLIS